MPNSIISEQKRNMKYIFAFFFLSFFTFSAQAQLKKTVHQTIEVGEARNINLDLYGEYEIEAWPGNTLMSETKIELYDASPHILKFFLEEQERYKILADNSGENLSVYSNDKERRSISYKGAQCYEIIKVKLYVPEEFEVVNPKTLRKKAD